LVWRNGKKMSKIINDYLHIPIFLLIISCPQCPCFFLPWNNFKRKAHKLMSFLLNLLHSLANTGRQPAFLHLAFLSVAGSILHCKKRKENFPHILGNSEGIGWKVIYEEGLSNI
jgi:hypothetical protein